MTEDHGAAEAARHGIARSPEWPRVEKAHLTLEPRCALCIEGGNLAGGVQVHHQFPFHYCIALGRPDLELDQRNLITLCEDEHDKPGENHHLLVGHLDDFKSSNVHVEDDVAAYKGMTTAEIKSDPHWLAAKATKLKPLDEMTDADKAAFRAAMDAKYPIAEKPAAA